MRALVLAAVVLLAAFAAPAQARTPVSGAALLVSTCPVQRPGDDCGPRPLPALALRFEARGHRVVAATTDAGGRFRVLLARGRYAVRVAGQVHLRCLDTVVVPGRRHVDLHFDNGLR